MGVPKLWDELQSAATVHSLTALACDAFKTNSNGKRGYRIGIDASIWTFHMEYGKEGENPELRLFFFRCGMLLQAPFLPLFIFDGPMRPKWKRGKRINASKKSPLVDGMQRIIDAFGFEWKLAPGEAEAELAYLNSMGVIDGILSDDVDNFLFGAQTVIRNPSNNLSGNKSNKALNSSGKDDGQHVRVFRSKDLDLTKEDMVLIGLCSGGDYNDGIEGCGIKIAVGLAKAGFGTRLVKARKRYTDSSSMEAFLRGWRNDLREELRTNSSGCLNRKTPALAQKVLDDFPDLAVLDSYLQPVTSQSKGRELNEYYNPDKMWEKEPNLELISGFCEVSFEWGFLDIILKRFRTLIWPGVTVRILRRAVLEQDSAGSSSSAPRTPRVRRKNTLCETPSKLLARHFNALSVGDTSDDEDESDALFSVITRTREHASTDGMLEYRVTVNPTTLVRMATQGVRGIRPPVATPDWSAEEDDDEGGRAKAKAKPPVDPSEPVLLWLPECIFKLAEPAIVEVWEDGIRKKENKKANTERKRQEREQKRVEKTPGSATAVKRAKKVNGQHKAASTSDLHQAMDPSSMEMWNPEESETSSSADKRSHTKPKGLSTSPKLNPKSTTMWNPQESEESSVEEMAAPVPPKPKAKRTFTRAATTGSTTTKKWPWADSDEDFDLPASRPIRDLSTKKRRATNKAPSATSASTSKPVELPRPSTKLKKANTMPSWQEVTSDEGLQPVLRPTMSQPIPATASTHSAPTKGKGKLGSSLKGKSKAPTTTTTPSTLYEDLFEDDSIVLPERIEVTTKPKPTKEWVDVSSDEGGPQGSNSRKHSLTPVLTDDDINKSPRKGRHHVSPQTRTDTSSSQSSITVNARVPQPFPMMLELETRIPETRPTSPVPQKREVIYISSDEEADVVQPIKFSSAIAASDSEIEFLD